ncbi:hypothetical protein BS78_03G102100 [Paspalum vaginatum]|nr:hypothetical protein BS78_03G102100 [Paspalum vaginatum]
MASLLLFLRVIVGAGADRLAGAGEDEAAVRERRQGTFRRSGDGGAEPEEEARWLVACLEWPRVDRKSAWMQLV